MDIFSFSYQSVSFFLALSIGVLVVNILTALAVIGVSWYAWRHINRLRREAHGEEKEAYAKATQILTTAHTEASETLRTASEKSREILKKVETVRDETLRITLQEIAALSEQHQQYLKDASLKYVESYEHMAEEAQEEYLATLRTASQGMARDAKHTLDMFEEYLKEQTVGYTQTMEQKIEALRSQANEYVDEYKRAKLKRVDDAIDEIIVIVAKHVIGRSINLKEHNELVIRALEEGKREGFFSHLNL